MIHGLFIRQLYCVFYDGDTYEWCSVSEYIDKLTIHPHWEVVKVSNILTCIRHTVNMIHSK